MVPELGRQTSCVWVEEERRVHELSEVVPGDLRQCARRHCVPMEIGWPWQVSWTAQEDHWAVAEKLTVLTHDMLRQGSCMSLEIMRTLFQDLCKK